MKKLFPIFLLIVTVLFSSQAFAAVKPATEGFYANDYANVLSNDTIDYIISENDRISATGAEIVVTTIDFTDGRDIKTYATDMFNSWGIGSSEKNNGILLLLSIGDEDYYVCTGKGIDRYIDAGAIQLILDSYLEDYFASGDYDKGVKKTFDALCSQVEKFYPVNGSSNHAAGSSSSNGSFGGIVPYSFFSAVVIIVIMFVFITTIASIGSRRRRYYEPGPRIPWYFFGRRRHHHHHHHHMPPPPPPAHRDGGFGGFGGGFGSGGARGGGGMSRGSGAGRSSGNRPSGGFSGGGFSSGGAGRSGGSRPSGGGGARGGGGMSRGSGAGRKK